MLATVAVVAGALTAGIGTATAAGSADLAGIPGFGSVDARPCGPSYSTAVEKQVGDVTVRKNVTSQAFSGSSLTSQIGFRVADGEAPIVHRLTDYPPSAAYKLQRLRIQWFEEVDGTWNRREDDHPVMQVDDQTGAVTITGVWPIGTDFVFFYDVPWTVKVGSIQESGVGFTATGFAPQDWPVIDGAGIKAVDPEICHGPPGNM
ncbi:hypothetical protein FK531_01245 [Rhodococcus spelaei]|uniref:Uncharacterized protein n=1 Tax=Rhodococcus spelaei TaxID=2546320 RepID=A0A541BQZ4_9NOCA|nr:hypothetical protein [Rhodococcus spelaei]TQF74750.1 hypothetical protein FK531_01245 [Rhodococcus spelaei]